MPTTLEEQLKFDDNYRNCEIVFLSESVIQISKNFNKNHDPHFTNAIQANDQRLGIRNLRYDSTVPSQI